jgi:hypothetical protein
LYSDESSSMILKSLSQTSFEYIFIIFSFSCV